MTRKSRSKLKEYFSKGKIPTQEHFEDLIDSALNIEDEGFEKTVSDGVRIGLKGGGRNLFTFFADDGSDRPLWKIALDPDKPRKLHFISVGDETPSGGAHEEQAELTVLTLTPRGRVGVSQRDPGAEGVGKDARLLDVSGLIKATGRVGVNPLADVPVAEGDPPRDRSGRGW